MIRLVRIFMVIAGFALALMAQPAVAQSRNAAFLDPSSAAAAHGSGGKGGGALANTVVADPAQTDAGETLVNVARRVTVFFYNGFRSPVTLNQLTLNADGNVRSKVLADDCKGLKNLPPQDRCSIVMEVVPSSPGPWSVELLLNHSGLGRIARAEVTGTTLGKTDEKSEGLAVSKKIAAAIDFGTVKAREESAARTMLIENDSTEPLKISSIDLITHDQQGLRLRPQGCKPGDELKPGESCPITVMWEPMLRENIATDLIVHHSGSLGFVVVPIRGTSAVAEAKKGEEDKGGKEISLLPQGGEPRAASLPPPSLDQIAKSLPPLDGKKLKKGKGAAEPLGITLIGTVGGRAILGTDDNQSYVVGLGESVAINDQKVELLQLDSTRAVVKVAGMRKELSIRRAPTILSAKKLPDLGGTTTGGAPGSPSPQAPASPSLLPSPSPAMSPAYGPGNNAPLTPLSPMGLNKS